MGTYTLLLPYMPGHAVLTGNWVVACMQPRKQSLVKKLINSVPTWSKVQSHISMHYFLDADIAVQAGIDRNRSAGKGNQVFVPADTDKGVVLLHKWLRRYARGSPPFPPQEPPGGVSRRQLLDRCDPMSQCRTVLATSCTFELFSAGFHAAITRSRSCLIR